MKKILNLISNIKKKSLPDSDISNFSKKIEETYRNYNTVFNKINNISNKYYSISKEFLHFVKIENSFLEKEDYPFIIFNPLFEQVSMGNRFSSQLDANYGFVYKTFHFNYKEIDFLLMDYGFEIKSNMKKGIFFEIYALSKKEKYLTLSDDNNLDLITHNNLPSNFINICEEINKKLAETEFFYSSLFDLYFNKLAKEDINNIIIRYKKYPELLRSICANIYAFNKGIGVELVHSCIDNGIEFKQSDIDKHIKAYEEKISTNNDNFLDYEYYMEFFQNTPLLKIALSKKLEKELSPKTNRKNRKI